MSIYLARYYPLKTIGMFLAVISYCGRQEEPVTLISRLLLRMRRMYVCSQHSFWLLLRMNGIHRRQSYDARFDLLSLVIWSHVFSLSVTRNLRKAQRWSKNVLTFNRCRPHSVTFGYYQLVIILLSCGQQPDLNTINWQDNTESEEDYRTGCRNVSHCQHQSYSGLHTDVDYHIPPTYDMIPRFKPFTLLPKNWWHYNWQLTWAGFLNTIPQPSVTSAINKNKVLLITGIL